MMSIVDTGVDGLNTMLGGGIPEGSSTLVLGSYGAGKTTMGIHFAYRGASKGENVVYFTLEERKESIIQASKTYNMDFSPYIDKNLFLLNPDTIEFVEMLKTEGNFKSSIESLKPKRIVIDSISLILMVAENDVLKRNVIINLSNALRDMKVTSLLLAESNVSFPYSSRDGLAEFVSDGVISLQNKYDDSIGSTTSIIRVLKMRLTNHDRKARPYSIGSNGLEILAKSELFQ
ncbi:MAG: ATPase domain-containing protein [Thermoplasmatales archaeon]|jgi:KaiC/GvpD/RAD55 family RecA-like ATPase